MFDLVIRDAEIFDGSGAKPVHGDLGVIDGRIAAIGPKLGAAKETVKADGLAPVPSKISAPLMTRSSMAHSTMIFSSTI